MKILNGATFTWLVLSILLNTDVIGQTVGYATTENISLPYNNQIRNSDGYPDYVDDATVQGRVPWLKDAGPRLDRCLSGMTIPQYFSVTYAPRITGPHRAESKVLRCTHDRESDQFECDAQPAPQSVVFDINPNQYFTIASDVSEDEAVSIIRAVLNEQVQFENNIHDPKLKIHKGMLGVIARDGTGFQIRYGDCGCSGNLKISIDASGAYFATAAGIALCV